MVARAGAVFAALAATLLVLGPASGASSRPALAAVELRGENGSGVHGVAFFRQSGRRLSGWVAVLGLTPRSSHAVHFHGPHSGSCAGASAPAIAAHADLVADAAGVASASFVVTSPRLVVRRGFYYNVHERAAAEGKSPSIACGDILPAR